MAAEYGWSSQEVDRLTDEKLQLVYLDSALDRKRADFRLAVEAGRAGAIFALDQKQYSRWRLDTDRLAGRARARTTLEQLARDYPDNVGRPN